MVSVATGVSRRTDLRQPWSGPNTMCRVHAIGISQIYPPNLIQIVLENRMLFEGWSVLHGLTAKISKTGLSPERFVIKLMRFVI